jgi:C1A family cysteine protease
MKSTKARAGSIYSNYGKDWRVHGAVTSIKNQGSCGSCYAFAPAAVIESALIIFKGFNNTINLSEQQLIGCTRYLYNNGCKGGYMDRCFKYLQTYKIMSERSYPYLGLDNHSCMYNESDGILNISSYLTLKTNNSEEIVPWVHLQPVAAGIAAMS